MKPAVMGELGWMVWEKLQPLWIEGSAWENFVGKKIFRSRPPSVYRGLRGLNG